MLWLEISISTSPEAADAVGNICIESGATGIALENKGDDVVVKAYLPVDDLLNSRVEDIRGRVGGLSLFGLRVGRGEITLRQIREEDWAEAWRAHYKPIHVGERIVIKPTWFEESVVERGRIVIEMDPGMAFGSGAHYTTSSCLELLERKMNGGECVVDLGTGSGILAIAAAKLGASYVLAVDVDTVAVEVARNNVKLNGVVDKVVVDQGDIIQILKGIPSVEVGSGGTPRPYRAERVRRGKEPFSSSHPDSLVPGSADIVLANIIAGVILQICEGVGVLLRPGGVFIASGIIKKRQRDVEAGMTKAGFSLEEVLTDGEWVTLCGRREGWNDGNT